MRRIEEFQKKTETEAIFGEVLNTLEKLRWTAIYAPSYLQTEYRRPPLLLLTKTARVEYHPMGVIGLIVCL
jgi:acyl-CoA reductase-like NAD-dependent aldehyde dehydrogenase